MIKGYQGILQREGEVVTKTGQTDLFSHAGSPATFGSGIFSDEATATARWEKEMVNECDCTRKFGFV